MGTPFLSFEPDPTVWRYSVGLLLSIFAIVLLSNQTVEGVSEYASILRDGNTLLLLTAIGLYATLLGIAMVCGARLVAHLLGGLRHRRLLRAEAKAAGWYGGSWLGLWHDHDEPIVGLQASLCEPMRLLPVRGGPTASLLRRLFWIWYDYGFVPVSDQAFWSIGMGRAQGADIVGVRMTGASPAPSAIAWAWPPLPPEAADPLLRSANAKASVAAAALRGRLAQLAEHRGADEALASLALSLSWQELIHTSYFDHAEPAYLIFGHVAELEGLDFPSIPNSLDTWRRNPSTPPQKRSVPRDWPIALTMARTLRVAVVCVLAAVAAGASYDAWIAPLTIRHAVDQIAQQLETPEFRSAEDEPNVGEVLLRLYALGRVRGPTAIEGILDPSSRTMAAERFAAALGQSFPNVRDWLPKNETTQIDRASIREHQHQISRSALLDLEAYGGNIPVRISFLAGMLEAGVRQEVIENTQIVPLLIEAVEYRQRPRPQIFYNPLSNENTKQVLSDLFNSPEANPALYQPPPLTKREKDLVIEAAAMIQTLGYGVEADDFLKRATGHGRDVTACTSSDFLQRMARFGATQAILTTVKACLPSKQARYLVLAALKADEAGRTDTAKTLLKACPEIYFNGLNASQRFRIIMLLLDLGRDQEAAAAVDGLIATWQTSDMIGGRALTLVTRFEKARRPDVAQTITSKMADTFKSEILDISGGSYVQGRQASHEASMLLLATGRRNEVLNLAREIRGGELPENDKLAEADIRAGILLTAADEAGASALLRGGLAMMPISDNPEENVKRVCSIVAMSEAAGYDAVQAAFLAAAEAISRIGDRMEQTKLFTALAQYEADAGYLNDAMRLIKRRLDGPHALLVYRSILNTALDRQGSKRIQAWGLGRDWKSMASKNRNSVRYSC